MLACLAHCEEHLRFRAALTLSCYEPCFPYRRRTRDCSSRWSFGNDCLRLSEGRSRILRFIEGSDSERLRTRCFVFEHEVWRCLMVAPPRYCKEQPRLGDVLLGVRLEFSYCIRLGRSSHIRDWPGFCAKLSAGVQHGIRLRSSRPRNVEADHIWHQRCVRECTSSQDLEHARAAFETNQASPTSKICWHSRCQAGWCASYASLEKRAVRSQHDELLLRAEVFRFRA